jgi:asparagine N-glycosylation enzyme membrane subunit Stt3
MMSRVQKGLAAGLAATISVSLLELGNLAMGSPVMAFPAFIVETLGLPGNLVVGWMFHLAIGIVVLGGGFGFLYAKLPTSTPATRGIVYAVGAFTVLLVGVLMVGDPRMFSGSDGFGTVAWLLMTHAVFGIVLGSVYGTLVAREKRELRAVSGTAAAH